MHGSMNIKHTGTPQQWAFWMQFAQLTVLVLHRKH